MEEIKKFGHGEILVFSLLYLFVDALCFLLDWTIVGAGFTPIIQGFVLFFMDKFLASKGSKNAAKLGRKVTKYLIQLLPLLPTLLTIFLVEATVHNRLSGIENALPTKGGSNILKKPKSVS